MKSITLDVTEVVQYRWAFTVPDDFDMSNEESLDALFTEDEDATSKGFVAVLERDISAQPTIHILFGKGEKI